MQNPWSNGVHRWSYTKAQAGARVEMYQGEWDKVALTAEAQAHEDIMAHTAMQKQVGTQQTLRA